MLNKQNLHIATIGKCVGLRGELKLHLHTDFIDQFTPNSKFYINKNEFLLIEEYTHSKSLVKFKNYYDRTAATKLVNKKLFSTVEESQKNCHLEEGEYFWFDMIGSKVLEGDLLLGVIDEIERIGNTDYIIVSTDESLVSKELTDKFYIPYIPTYIDHFDSTSKVVYTHGGFDILEAS